MFFCSIVISLRTWGARSRLITLTLNSAFTHLQEHRSNFAKGLCIARISVNCTRCRFGLCLRLGRLQIGFQLQCQEMPFDLLGTESLLIVFACNSTHANANARVFFSHVSLLALKLLLSVKSIYAMIS